MGSVLHPVGSRPTQVYWLRRGAVVLAAVLVVAALAFVFRPQPEEKVSAAPSASASTPAAGTTPTPAATTTPSATTSATPTGPLACDASNSTLSLAGFQKVKQDGKQTFRLAITNTSKAACVVDLKASTFSLVVMSGSDKIWTTAHCEKWVPAFKGKLKAGKAHEFSIAWGVNRSGQGCRTAKALLGAGTYVASAAYAGDAKARQVFVVTKAG